MAIAHQGTQLFTKRMVSNGSPGWLLGYALFAAVVIAASIFLALGGQGLAELDPSQIVGP